MPVTIKLSQKLSEKLGDDVANELVDWFNKVDATHRGDLRELNELNFARFDAKLGQRLAELDAKWHVRWGQLEARLDAKTAGLALRTDLADVKADLLKWMFAFWAPTALAVLTLLLRS